MKDDIIMYIERIIILRSFSDILSLILVPTSAISTYLHRHGYVARVARGTLATFRYGVVVLELDLVIIIKKRACGSFCIGTLLFFFWMLVFAVIAATETRHM